MMKKCALHLRLERRQIGNLAHFLKTDLDLPACFLIRYVYPFLVDFILSF